MDHGDPGNARYTGMLAEIATGGMVLIVIFLASGSSAPRRIEHEGGGAAWRVGILVVPNV